MEFLQDSINQKILAASLIFIFGFLHVMGVKLGGFIQNAITLIKIIVVLSLVVFGLYFADWSHVSRLTESYNEGASFFSPTSSFALLMIMFAYSGWNGATYIAGEIKDPARNLPRAMFWGVVSVAIVYLLLNVVFLISSPGNEIIGTETVGSVAVKNLFGIKAASFFSTAIVLVLLSAVSVQMMIGPRVYYAMAKDGVIFSSLTRINEKHKTPDFAIWLQTFIAVIYVFIGKEHISGMLMYMGFALSIFPLLAVIGMVYMRITQPNLPRPYKVKAYPLVAGIYILLTSVMMITSLIVWTKTSLFAIGVLVIGTVVYFVWKKKTS
jgi:APA family basic amino acid/polyamine antiporter